MIELGRCPNLFNNSQITKQSYESKSTFSTSYPPDGTAAAINGRDSIVSRMHNTSTRGKFLRYASQRTGSNSTATPPGLRFVNSMSGSDQIPSAAPKFTKNPMTFTFACMNKLAKIEKSLNTSAEVAPVLRDGDLKPRRPSKSLSHQGIHHWSSGPGSSELTRQRPRSSADEGTVQKWLMASSNSSYDSDPGYSGKWFNPKRPEFISRYRHGLTKPDKYVSLSSERTTRPPATAASRAATEGSAGTAASHLSSCGVGSRTASPLAKSCQTPRPTPPPPPPPPPPPLLPLSASRCQPRRLPKKLTIQDEGVPALMLWTAIHRRLMQPNSTAAISSIDVCMASSSKNSTPRPEQLSRTAAACSKSP
mmetsp:Transcript_97412/g.279903  ORF Transcript_97412/g.279903 Transcript_97412/m.279903 type:complete len:364 (-) Transcript_97412:24-1115(-)